MKLLLLEVAVTILLPFVAFGAATCRRWFAVLAGSWVVFALLTRFPLPLEVDPYFAFVLLAVVQLGMFSYLLATAADVKWSANRAALIALLVYAVAIPGMQRQPLDGDEPYYLLATESLVHDHDLDLRNQYADLAHSATGRDDLKPQYGDPVGPHGEVYSRQEPFLSVLLIPGYLAGGLLGALATIALFGALLVRSTIRLFEDEGIGDAAARVAFPLLAFGPPILFYAARIWPEVPAAWAFVEALRGVRQRRAQRWLPAVMFLSLLKLRFLLIAGPLVAWVMAKQKRARLAIIAALLLAIPMFIVWRLSGSATNVHVLGELVPGTFPNGLTGLFGLILDGAAGIAFQAPFYLLGIFALTRWRSMPPAFRLGIVTSLIYIIYLVPRPEWHGGWSPPLRYIVVLMPVLALGAAAMIERSRDWLAPIGLATMALVAHGFAYPYRLFHIFNGENCVGEWLSQRWQADFSRLFPSFIRPNVAAVVASLLLVALLALRPRLPAVAIAPLLALGFAAALTAARTPGAHIELEDAHVVHKGGELYPHEYTVMRFAYRGGWIVRAGDALTFRARAGASTLRYTTGETAMIDIDGNIYLLPPTVGYGTARVTIPRTGTVSLRCLSGSANLDKLDHD